MRIVGQGDFDGGGRFHPPICCYVFWFLLSVSLLFEGHEERRRDASSRRSFSLLSILSMVSVCLVRSFALAFTRRRHMVSVSFLLVMSFCIIAIFVHFSIVSATSPFPADCCYNYLSPSYCWQLHLFFRSLLSPISDDDTCVCNMSRCRHIMRREMMLHHHRHQ